VVVHGSNKNPALVSIKQPEVIEDEAPEAASAGAAPAAAPAAPATKK